MSYKLLGREKNEVKFEMTFGKQELENSIQSVYKKNRSKFAIPGFRKGKAPRKMIEAQYGEGVFFEDALNDLINETYPKLVTELELYVVDRPTFDLKEMQEGKDIVLEGTVIVAPEVEINDYKGLEVEDVVVNVTDEDVDAELQKSRELNGRLIVIEDRAVEDGDTTIIDFKGSIDGEEFEGGSGEDFNLVIGSGKFIPGYEEQLIGKNAGEEVEVKVTFPEDYHASELAGKEAIFMTTIKEIKTMELPELDDEFAKDTSEFDTLDELKTDIRANLEKSAKENVVSAKRDKVVEAVIEKLEADIPEIMFENEINDMIRNLDHQLQYQGMSLDMYLQFSGQTLDSMKEQMRADAETRVKTGLAIEAIAKKENVEVLEDDVESEFKSIAEKQNKSVDEIKEMYGNAGVEYIKDTLRVRKTVDLLVDNAKFVSVEE